MEKKERRMETTLLDINLLKQNSFKKFDKEKFNKTFLFTQKYGQLKPILVNKEHEILDGNYIVKALQKIGTERVTCLIMDCSTKEQLKLKLCLSFLNYDHDNLLLSDIFAAVVENKLDAQNLSGILDLTAEQIERYKKLADLDWVKELKKAQDETKQQTSLF